MIPDNMSAFQLEKLFNESTVAGKTPVNPQEFKIIAEVMAQELECMYEEIKGYVPDNVLSERWKYVDHARVQMKNALRSLRKSIQC